MLDCRGRDIHYLRISVTDRCNLRCVYCMPAEGVEWVEHSEILTYEEILRLARLFARLGIDRIRLTGGEPLARRGLDGLIAGLKAIPGIRRLALTTNGVLLAGQLPRLTAAGLDAVNLSLDTLDRGQYAAITRRDCLPQALEGIAAARAVPGLDVKINCVPTGDNADQWVPLAALTRETPALDVRFIELMPIGLGRSLPRRTEGQVLARLEEAFGPALLCPQEAAGGPSRYVTFSGFAGRVGFISALSHQFCGGCNRVRLTAQGLLKPCLQYESHTDLRALLRSGADDRALLEVMERAIYQKPACHHFDAPACPEDEGRNMNQIGG